MLLFNLILIIHPQPDILISPKKMENIQITQNNCSQYCLQLDKMAHNPELWVKITESLKLLLDTC